MRDESIDNLALLTNAVYANCGDLVSNLGGMMAGWYRSTLLNTLGLALSQSVADFAGVQGDSVSYSFSDDEDGCHIDVFDDDAEGNGSTELAYKYFHIPIH